MKRPSKFSVVFSCIVFFLCNSADAQANATRKSQALGKMNSVKVDIEMQRLVLKKINAIDFESLNEHSAIYYLLDIAKSLDQIDKQELGQTVWHRAKTIVDATEKLNYQTTIFQAALTFKDLTIASKFVSEVEGEKDKFLDSLDLEIFKRTFSKTKDRSAIANVPRQELDFWLATEIGQAYVAAGDFEGANRFVEELDIPHKENDPRTVGTWVYKSIAREMQSNGDMAGAKKYADKAMEIGGNLYYSGYGVKILRRSIYGELTKGLKQFAQLGERHRGHQGRELVQSLIAELVSTGYLKEAVQCTSHLADQKDIDKVLWKVSIAYQKHGKHDLAISTVRKISSPSTQVAAKLLIAAELWHNKKVKLANSLFEKSLMELDSIEDWRTNTIAIQSVAEACVVMAKKDDYESLFSKCKSPLGKAKLVTYAIRKMALIQPGK